MTHCLGSLGPENRRRVTEIVVLMGVLKEDVYTPLLSCQKKLGIVSARDLLSTSVRQDDSKHSCRDVNECYRGKYGAPRGTLRSSRSATDQLDWASRNQRSLSRSRVQRQVTF